jgi:hypothetical protein
MNALAVDVGGTNVKGSPEVSVGEDSRAQADLNSQNE